jgi:hypothetical protein
MYNMDISILGYKFNLEILILIGVVYLILVGHTLCGCSNFYSLIEGNTSMGQSNSSSNSSNSSKSMGQSNNSSSQSDASGNMMNQIQQKMQSNMPTQTTSKEGFVGANTNYGESSAFNLSDTMPVNTSSWSAQNMTVVPGQPLSKGVKQFLARKPQPVPLPEGEMLMFANTPFKPECCPNTYSNSSGCACMSGGQYNYLIMRGGNNVPYSEY